MPLEIKTHSPEAVSNFFIQKSLDSKVELTPMKLLKLAFLAHGWGLAYSETPLIPEAVRAWKYGPVIPSIYHGVKSYGNQQIDSLRPLDSFWRRDEYPIVTDTNTLLLLEKIWQVYGDKSGPALSTKLHEPNSPWDIVWNQQGGRFENNAIIRNELIKDYYSSKVAHAG